ncbi:hypothetical protein JVT61DRAFT_4610 [Boletus reticuloceps]|uniref:Uncharacterized protein n=1 Tax=Boletus reticuloceps TaxID=495285 RepID=A0A8I2YLH3_9AGAM|nr:hypothetical protein JVT61DRAFT_4610 [Boletus reticuloceps]
MPPPPVPTQGPNIDIPSVPSLPPGLGYGVQYLQYAAQRDHWAHITHYLPHAKTISLEISVLYKNSSKGRALTELPLVFKSIYAGLKDILAIAPTTELVVVALEMVMPRIKAFNSRFAWHEHEFVVCDAK